MQSGSPTHLLLTFMAVGEPDQGFHRNINMNYHAILRVLLSANTPSDNIARCNGLFFCQPLDRLEINYFVRADGTNRVALVVGSHYIVALQSSLPIICLFRVSFQQRPSLFVGIQLCAVVDSGCLKLPNMAKGLLKSTILQKRVNGTLWANIFSLQTFAATTLFSLTDFLVNVQIPFCC